MCHGPASTEVLYWRAWVERTRTIGACTLYKLPATTKALAVEVTANALDCGVERFLPKVQMFPALWCDECHML